MKTKFYHTPYTNFIVPFGDGYFKTREKIIEIKCSEIELINKFSKENNIILNKNKDVYTFEDEKNYEKWKHIKFLKSDKNNKFYVKEKKKHFKIFKFLNKESVKLYTYDYPGILNKNKYFILNSLLIHNNENILLFFSKTNSLVAIEIFKLKTEIDLGNFLEIIEFELIANSTKYDLRGLDDIEIMEIIEKTKTDELILSFKLNIDSHIKLMNLIIIAETKDNILDEEIEKTIKSLETP